MTGQMRFAMDLRPGDIVAHGDEFHNSDPLIKRVDIIRDWGAPIRVEVHFFDGSISVPHDPLMIVRLSS